MIVRAPSLSSEQGDEVARLYRQGMTVEALMGRFESGRKRVVTALKQRRVAMRPRGRQPKRQQVAA